MGAILSYSLSSGLVLLFLYLTYRWLLASERQPCTNRFLLLSFYPVALLAPLAYDRLPSMFLRGLAEVDVRLGSPEAYMADTGTGTPALVAAFVWIYIAGAAAVFLYFAYSYIRLRGIVGRGRHTDVGEFTLVTVADRDIPPFSWNRYIVMSEQDYATDGTAILLHEKRHIRGHHCLDLLLAQGMTVFQWFNPAAWLMTDELRTVHEYQADDAVIRSGVDVRDYQMLLIKKAVGARLPSLANSLNQSKLKKRITMMYKSRPASARRLKGLALLPALALGLLAVNSPVVASVLSETTAADLFSSAESKVNEKNPDIAMPSSVSVNKNGDAVETAVEVIPEFPGGIKKMMQFLMENVQYPAEAQKNNEEGIVVVNFVVSKTGKIGNVQIMKGVSPSLDKEAVRVVKSMPVWTPGKKDGKNVACYFSLPVSFKLK